MPGHRRSDGPPRLHLTSQSHKTQKLMNKEKTYTRWRHRLRLSGAHENCSELIPCNEKNVNVRHKVKWNEPEWKCHRKWNQLRHAVSNRPVQRRLTRKACHWDSIDKQYAYMQWQSFSKRNTNDKNSFVEREWKKSEWEKILKVYAKTAHTVPVRSGTSYNCCLDYTDW